MFTRSSALLSVLIMLLLGTGCTSGRSATDTASDVMPDLALAGPTWRLEAFGDDDDAPGARAFGITAFFGADGRITGSAGCNRYFGSYDARGETLRITQIGATRMACEPGAMQRERAFLSALDAARGWERDGDELELEDAAGETVLTFTAQDEATLTGVVTYLPRIALAPDAVVTVRLLDVSRADAPATVLAEETITTQRRSVPIPFTLRYGTDDIRPRHRYAVRADIRDAQGALEWTSDTVIPVLTHGAPDSGVEIRVVQASGERDQGDLQSGLLVGPEWHLDHIVGRDGTVTTPEAGETYTIQFGTDGRYNGQADCNRYGGTYEIEADGELDLDSGLTTLAACAPPSSSDAFFAVLGDVETHTLTGDRLTLHAEDGRAALVFTR